MEEPIINRVANSVLVTVDLEDLYPEGTRVQLDISPWLYEGIVLREKDFRASVKAHTWKNYKNQYVAIHCATDAIVPSWAYLFVSLQLSGIAKKTVVGSLDTLETILFSEILHTLDISAYKNKPLIIKGCAHKPIPENAYVLLGQKLQPVAKSMMYGEACSAVPLYKQAK